MKSFALASITAFAVAEHTDAGIIANSSWYADIGPISTDDIYMWGFMYETMINDGGKE